jgi:methionyl-tRNA formyltransferase
MGLRLAFMGTPDFAVVMMDALVAAGHHLVAVYCQPPRPAGRGQKLRPSPVQKRAEALGLCARTPKSLKSAQEQAAFAALELDVAVVAAYGLILPAGLLRAPRLGCVNVHASLLPRWRGAAPIQHALLAGDAETGVTIMQMDEGLDTGAMLLREALPIVPGMTAPQLHDALARLGAECLLKALEGLARGDLRATPQPSEGVTYAAKIEKEQGALDLGGDACAMARRIAALQPWPGCWIDLADGERLKVLEAEAVDAPSVGADPPQPGTLLDDKGLIACGRGALRLLTVQRPGRNPVDAVVFLRDDHRHRLFEVAKRPEGEGL